MPNAAGSAGAAFAGAGGSAGGSTPAPGGSAGSAGAAPFVEPTLLSQTGLYTDTAKATLAPGVREFHPRYELWSDGAAKKRWVLLPPNATIDTSNMDFWAYPVGTKLWKEFTRNNAAGMPVRVETRLIHKYLDQNNKARWFMAAFVWNEAQTDAEVTTDGVPNARGTDHDVPSKKTCTDCHSNVLDKALGFSALQLSHDGAGVNLSTLIQENRLSAPPPGNIALPGTLEQQRALGYMHGNCGSCHNEFSQHAALGMEFWLKTSALGSVNETNTYLTTVGAETNSQDKPPNDLGVRIVPKMPEQSAVYQRVALIPPGDKAHMPQIATELTDMAGAEAIRVFIDSL